MIETNETHKPDLQSWLASANVVDCDFPIQNLPFAIFRRDKSNEIFRGGVAIGDQIIDLLALSATPCFSADAQQALEAAAKPTLNDFMALGKPFWSALRLALSRSLRENSAGQKDIEPCLINQADAEYDLPCQIGDYTDFYTSIYHATAIGKQFRPDNPLLPNYKWIPIGYHGRVSSIGVSGQSFHRPIGQLKRPDETIPSLGPCKRLDYELEMGIFAGPGNDPGHGIAIGDAEDHLFGMCLLNDWSARDIQAWEYQPLGPFLAKSFATTISPWIVTAEALAPFRVPFSHPPDDPQPLDYLSSSENSHKGGLDIQLEVSLQTEQSANDGSNAMTLSQSNFKHSYWTVAQLIAHHSVNGCNLRPGDLFGSGTQSGPKPEQAGSLMELSHGGNQAITLPNGESRTFLEDGDTVIFSAWCASPCAKKIGFGRVTGTVLPSIIRATIS